jgi:hypothetical protein
MATRDVPPGPRGRTGLRRHPALVPLSRDHHDVLVQVLWLRRALPGPPEALRRTAEGFLSFYEEEMTGHMKDEEDVVLPRAGHADAEGAERIRAEHREIHALAAGLRAALDDPVVLPRLAVELAQLVDDHVRFEERAFFMRVQETLDAPSLEALGAELQESREARGRVEACRRPPPGPQGTS